MEAVATLMALTVGLIALVRFYTKKSNAFLYLGAGFVGTALLDGYHAVVTSQWFAHVWPSPPAHLIPWSWNASRTFLSILLCLSLMAWREPRGGARKVSENAVLVGVGILAVACFIFFSFVPLPRAYYPELITGRPEEFVAAAFFGFALVGYWRKGAWRNNGFENWLMMSIIVGLASQAVFMPFSFGLFDAMFDVAHTLKIVSYACVLTGLLISMYAVFKQAEATSKALARHAGALARSNAELEQFASIASHDLQEPLRKIQAFGDRLEAKYADGLDERGLDYVQRMRGAAARMQALVESLLTLSRVTSGAKPFERVNLGNVVADVLTDLDLQIQQASGQVHVGELPTVECDATQMRQLFQNLVSNAIKFRRDDVAPVVTIRDCTPAANGDSTGAHPNGDYCLLEVQDNGIGFDEKHTERIFRIFQRLHARTEY